MNERINELALQAEQYADDTMNADPATYDKEGQVKVWRELMQAKFAELIVEECFKAAMIESKGHLNPIDLVKRMKERVGVEE